ncbi:TPA_asm: hypothetical protein G2718_04630 [Salmonella enterica subsp. enterica serovar Enteritidis]|nr:hypothetical protein [Salmonella enterica subsp. enterica serovar Enteritidis]
MYRPCSLNDQQSEYSAPGRSDIAPEEVDVVATLPLSEYFDTHSPGKTKR